jgi:hypothetical protein
MVRDQRLVVGVGNEELVLEPFGIAEAKRLAPLGAARVDAALG